MLICITKVRLGKSMKCGCLIRDSWEKCLFRSERK